MYADVLQKMARECLAQALCGTWAKIGKSKYQRRTGEIVEKRGNQWSGDGCRWQSAYAAISRIDYRYRVGELIDEG